MESKIRVEHDFETAETWVDVNVSTTNAPGTQPDMRDLALKGFIQKASYTHNELYIEYPKSSIDNSVVHIKVREKCVVPVDLNWVGLNATSIWNQGPVYKSEQSYNLQFATGDNHHVYIKTLGENDIMEYEYLSDFIEQWGVNPAKRS